MRMPVRAMVRMPKMPLLHRPRVLKHLLQASLAARRTRGCAYGPAAGARHAPGPIAIPHAGLPTSAIRVGAAIRPHAARQRLPLPHRTLVRALGRHGPAGAGRVIKGVRVRGPGGGRKEFRGQGAAPAAVGIGSRRCHGGVARVDAELGAVLGGGSVAGCALGEEVLVVAGHGAAVAGAADDRVGEALDVGDVVVGIVARGGALDQGGVVGRVGSPDVDAHGTGGHADAGALGLAGGRGASVAGGVVDRKAVVGEGDGHAAALGAGCGAGPAAAAASFSSSTSSRITTVVAPRGTCWRGAWGRCRSRRCAWGGRRSRGRRGCCWSALHNILLFDWWVGVGVGVGVCRRTCRRCSCTYTAGLAGVATPSDAGVKARLVPTTLMIDSQSALSSGERRSGKGECALLSVKELYPSL